MCFAVYRSLLQRHLRGVLIYNAMLILLTACFAKEVEPVAEVDLTNSDARFIVKGSVGDGPITGATVSVLDANGATLMQTQSDMQANYRVEIPIGAIFPLVVKAQGGTDMVTATPPSFTLYSVVNNPFSNIVNINPFSTIIYKAAATMPGGLTTANLSQSNQLVLTHLNFGLDPRLVRNPMTTAVTAENGAVIIKASEVLAETIRRVRTQLLDSGMGFSEDELIDVLAADLIDGSVDGLAVVTTDAVSAARISATFNLISAETLVEAMTGRLQVDGVDAAARMDMAVNLSVSNSTMSTADVLIPPEMLDQAKTSVAAAKIFQNGPAISTLAVILAGLSANSSAVDIAAVIAHDYHAEFTAMFSQLRTSNASQLQLVNDVVRVGSIGNAGDPTGGRPVSLNPGKIAFSAATYSISEANATISIHLQRTDGSVGQVALEWKTQSNTATYGADYGDFDWTPITFADGETSKVQPITIVSDTLVEGNETFNVLLRNPVGGAILGLLSNAVITIQDDDSNPSVVVDPIIDSNTPGKLYPAEAQYRIVSTPNVSKPGYLTAITDPIYATKITRVTDDVVFGQANVRHYYSKEQPWNSNGSLIRMKSWLLDGHTYEIKSTHPLSGEVKWSHTNPNIMFNVSGISFARYEVSNKIKTVLHTFTGYELCNLGPWEGNLSIDDKYVALACKQLNDLVVVVYDIQSDTIVSATVFAGDWGDSKVDWLSMSQSGNYVVIAWRDSRGVRSYDRQLSLVAPLAPNVEHGDIGFDTAGNEVWVAVISPGIATWRLDTGKKTNQFPSDDGGHVSCRNTGLPGWCYISSDANNDVFALKLDGSQTVRQFAHHHSDRNNYLHEAQAVPNPDGSKVMFASIWGGVSVSSYVVEMP